ncbi:hypothetical protein U1Q18_001687 [Sarracenia purpurea var. burkii]
MAILNQVAEFGVRGERLKLVSVQKEPGGPSLHVNIQVGLGTLSIVLGEVGLLLRFCPTFVARFLVEAAQSLLLSSATPFVVLVLSVATDPVVVDAPGGLLFEWHFYSQQPVIKASRPAGLRQFGECAAALQLMPGRTQLSAVTSWITLTFVVCELSFYGHIFLHALSLTVEADVRILEVSLSGFSAVVFLLYQAMKDLEDHSIPWLCKDGSPKQASDMDLPSQVGESVADANIENSNRIMEMA